MNPQIYRPDQILPNSATSVVATKQNASKVGKLSVVLACLGLSIPAIFIGMSTASSARKYGRIDKLAKLGVKIGLIVLIVETVVFSLFLFNYFASKSEEQDAIAINNVNYISVELEEFYIFNLYYPEDLNSLDAETAEVVSEINGSNRYTYDPDKCSDGGKCRSFVFSYDTESGDDFKKASAYSYDSEPVRNTIH